MPTPSRQLLSRTIYDTDGVTTDWEFAFSGGYLSTDHVKARVSGVGAATEITVTPAMLTGAFTMRIVPALPVGQILTIYRNTPKDLPIVDFTDEAGFTEIALDTNAKQAIFVAAEATDDVTVVSSTDSAIAAQVATAAAAQATAAASAAAADAQQINSLLNLISGYTIAVRASGNGTQTAFPLTVPAGNINVSIYIGGIYQQRNTYVFSSNTVVFTEAPVAGTENIEFVLEITQAGAGGGGGGDVIGPNSATNNALVKFNGTSGKLVQASNVTVDGAGNIATPGAVSASDLAYTGTLTGGTGVVNLGSGQFVKDASGNVGIGTASPASKLHTYASSGNVSSRIESGSAGSVAVSTIYKTSARTWEIGQAPGIGDNSFTIYDATAGAVRGQFDTSGNLGLGVTPSAWSADSRAIEGYAASGFAVGSKGAVPCFSTSNVYRNTSGVWTRVADGYGYVYGVAGNGNDTGYQWNIAPSGLAGSAVSFTQAMALSASGNLGLGVTPSAWGGSYTGAMQYKYGASIANNLPNDAHFGTNCYHDGTAWKYISTGYACSRYEQFAGGHYWFGAPSGTAGNPISFTQAMALASNGDLTLTAGTGWLKTDGGDTGITLGANQGGGASLKYNSNGNLDITPRSGFNTVVTAGNLLVGTTSNPTSAKLVVEGKATIGAALHEKKVVVAAANIDVGSASLFTRTISGATTFTVSNVPATGTVASFILDLTNGGSATVTWWSGVKWAGGAAPTLTASGRDVLGFFTHDGGTTWTGMLMAKDAK